MPQPFNLRTPLSPADLRFESMTHSAALNALEEMQLLAVSTRADIDTDKLLGELAEVEINLRDGKKRVISGYITRFGMGVHKGRYFGYQAVVRPWLWFLTRTSDCRIFQEQTVQEIVEAVFADHSAIAKYEFKLVRQYRKRTYCVQYRETDFNFVARLLEDEGIAWYFEHSPGGDHKLMLVDDISCHQPIEGDDTLRYYANVGQVPPDTEYVSHWNFTRTVKPGVAALTSYDFENPGLRLDVERAATRHHRLADLEVFDYQGDYLTKDDGQQQADSRIDERQSQFERLTGQTNSHTLQVGHLFHLEGHPRDDQNAEHLVTQTTIQASAQSDQTGTGPGDYQCAFTAMPSSQQFRPLRVTPKPFVQGPQTAVVVGPEGEEIFTDKYGRVKVHFFWDRFGDLHEKSSCWIRVSSPWAGKSFGFIQVPRIGQEVVVDFLEGDPDQPIITGRVYNADQMPPWQLPANASQSGVMTRSTPGGSYANSSFLQFEDKKGKEKVSLHSELDYAKTVEQDEKNVIGRHRQVTVTKHDSLWVGEGREVTVAAKGENYKITGPRVKVLIGHEREEISDGKDTIITGEYGEYTTGTRKSWTSADYIFKSTGAYFDAGPEFFVKAGDIKLKAGGGTFTESGGDFNARAANFKFAANANLEFTGVNFNRTIMQGNDIVLGPNTNCYIGSSRNTAVGMATSAFLGLQNQFVAGMSVSGFLGMQISNTVAISITNSLMSLTNNLLTLGVTGFDLSTKATNINLAPLTMYNGGGGAGGAGAAGAAASGTPAAIAAALGGAFGLGAGAAGGIYAAAMGVLDVHELISNPALTPDMRNRLLNVVSAATPLGGLLLREYVEHIDGQSTTPEVDTTGMTPEQAAKAREDAQIARLRDGYDVTNPETGKTEHQGGTPAATPKKDPTAGLDGPPPAPPAEGGHSNSGR